VLVALQADERVVLGRLVVDRQPGLVGCRHHPDGHHHETGDREAREQLGPALVSGAEPVGETSHYVGVCVGLGKSFGSYVAQTVFCCRGLAIGHYLFICANKVSIMALQDGITSEFFEDGPYWILVGGCSLVVLLLFVAVARGWIRYSTTTGLVLSGLIIVVSTLLLLKNRKK